MAVRTRAKGSYVLSGRPELSETELASLREELSEVLMRGVPRERAGEGAFLRSLELRDNRLSFEVECGTLVWATDAVFIRLMPELSATSSPSSGSSSPPPSSPSDTPC
jgi:hypothetical protein